MEKSNEKEVSISFTGFELSILGFCINMAENCSEVGSEVKERYYKAVDSMRQKLDAAQLSFEVSRSPLNPSTRACSL